MEKQNPVNFWRYWIFYVNVMSKRQHELNFSMKGWWLIVSHSLWKWILFSIQNLNGESDDIDIRTANDEYINMTLKNKMRTLKNLIEIRQMTLNDPKFDIKKPLDTLLSHQRCRCSLTFHLQKGFVESNLIYVLS